MTNPNVAELAAGLSEAQKRAVLSFNDKRYLTATAAGVSGSSAYSLWNRPPGPNLEAPLMLLSRDYVDWPRLSWAYRLTKLGAEVRHHLISQETTHAE